MGKKTTKQSSTENAGAESGPEATAPTTPVTTPQAAPKDGPASLPAIEMQPPTPSTPLEPEVEPPVIPRGAPMPKCPANENALFSPWSFWYDRREKADSKENYASHLKQLCCFTSVESFWRHYQHMAKPSQFQRECNLHMFRENFVPMWESFPDGGCWIIKLCKKTEAIDRVWETLVLAVIGEVFEEPDLVGVVLSVRSRQDMIAIWNRDNQQDSVRFAIGERLKQLLHLAPNSVIEYKKHMSSMKDNSTYRNAKPYVVGSE